MKTSFKNFKIDHEMNNFLILKKKNENCMKSIKLYEVNLKF